MPAPHSLQSRSGLRGSRALPESACRFLASLLLATVAIVAYGQVLAQDTYPAKAIRFVVPYPPGGVSDNSSRAIADRLGKALGASMVIENKAGAASTNSLVLNPILQGKVEYDPTRDFTPVSMMITSAFVLHVNKDVKATNLAELLALVRAHPDQYSIGTSGMGSMNHLASELFIKTFGLKMTVVHYKGGMPAAQDMVGGQVQMMFSAVNEAMPFLQGGRTRALAVSTRERVPQLPDVPTVDEATGTQGFDAVYWLALVAPAGTPAPVLTRLGAAMQELGKDTALRDDLARKGVNLKVSGPQEVRDTMDRDEKKWGQIIRELGIRE